MILYALLHSCRAAGVELFLSGQSLRHRGPAGALTRELRQELQTHKQELVDFLRNQSPWDAARAAAVLAECGAILNAGRSILTPSQTRVAEVYRDLARRYVEQHDPVLWGYPGFLHDELARWRQTRQAARTLCKLKP